MEQLLPSAAGPGRQPHPPTDARAAWAGLGGNARNRAGFLSRLVLAALGALCLWLAAGPNAHAQAPAWQAALPLDAAGQGAYAATDASGNVYLAGTLSGTQVFGNTVLSANGNGFYVACWNPQRAAFVWAVQGGTAGAQTYVSGIAVSGGSVYVVGSASAGATFGTVTATGSGTVLVAKLTAANGIWTWATLVGSTSTSTFPPYGTAVAVSGSSVYLAGNFNANATFGTTTLTSNGLRDGFVAKLTDAGSSASVGWAVRMGGSAVNTYVETGGYGVSLVASGSSVYVAGDFYGAAGFGNTTLTSTAYVGYKSPIDAFVAKLTDAGSTASFNWAQQAGGPNDDGALALAVSGSSVYVAGYFSGTAGFGAGTQTAAGDYDAFVSKLTDAGNSSSFAWTRAMGGPGEDIADCLALNGNAVYVAGTFTGTAGFGGTSLTAAGSYDLFVSGLSDAGSSASFLWTQRAGGADKDAPTGLVLSGNTLYASGYSASNPVVFGNTSLPNGPTSTRQFMSFLAALGSPTLNLAAPNGPVGTPVTLYGAGLGGTTAVSFGGVAATGFAVNAAGTQLTVVVPAGAATGPVTVTNAFGVSNTITYSVLPANPAPAWQALAPATQAAGNFSLARATATDAGGNVYVAGYFYGTVGFGSSTLTSAGGLDVFVAKYSPGQNRYLWAVRAGGTGDDVCLGLAASNGILYLTGDFTSPTAAFGGSSLLNTDATGNTYDGFLVKLTDAGSSAAFGWAQRISGSSSANGAGSTSYYENTSGVAVSGSTVYVSGRFGSPYLNLGGSSVARGFGIYPMFVAKYTDNGSSAAYAWVQQGGGASNTYNFFPTLAVSGTSLYVSGTYVGATAQFGTTTLPNADATGNSYDGYVAKLTDAGSAGSFAWALGFGGSSYDYCYGLAASGSSVYLTGSFLSAPAQFGSITVPNVNGNSNGAFVAKLTDAGSTGSFAWAQGIGGGVGYALAVSGSGVYVGGYLNQATPAVLGGSSVATNGGVSAVVVRLTDAGSSGSFDWARVGDAASVANVFGLAATSTAVFAVGYLNPTAAFGSQVVSGPLAGGSNAFVAAISANPLATAAPAALAPARTLYPNPAHDQATVPVPAGTPAVRVLDALGREVRRQAVAAGAAEAVLDLRGLPAGLYLVRAGQGPGQRLQVE